MRDSLSLLDQVLASSEGRLSEEQAAAVLGVADRRLIMALGGAIAGRDPATALSLLDDAFRRGFDLPQLARTLLAHLRDLVVVSVVKEPQTLLEVPASELPDLEARATALSAQLVDMLLAEQGDDRRDQQQLKRSETQTAVRPQDDIHEGVAVNRLRPGRAFPCGRHSA